MPQDQVSYPEGVQHLGQLPNPDEIAARIETLTKRAADAQRTVLECDLEIAKLLAIMTDHHGYKSKRFVSFASQHGLSRTDAYDLVHLAGAADDIVAEHEAATRDDPRHEWPSWRECWHKMKHGDDDDEPEEGGYWITPPDLYSKWDDEFHFDFDPFPFPRPPGYDALTVEWGNSNYVNASFRREHAGGVSLTQVVHKAVEERKKGKTVVMPIPTTDALVALLTAGAEVRRLGRVKWLHTRTREPYPQPGNCALFILRP